MIQRQVQAKLPTKWGDYTIYAYADSEHEKQPHLALVHREADLKGPVAVRIHSECITGDLFGSRRCDCGDQFIQSMRILQEKRGIMIYLRQEGRGIGLINKLEAYNLQDQGMDTVEANVHLGFEADERDYRIALDMLRDLGVLKLELITNNPDKIAAFDKSEIDLLARIPLVIPAHSENEDYMKIKKKVMGHLL